MAYVTADIGPLIDRDVLLQAGGEDHLVPMEFCHVQIRMLTNAQSITARLITTSQSAVSHCQVRNCSWALRCGAVERLAAGFANRPSGKGRAAPM
jgi:hypothetical protein